MRCLVILACACAIVYARAQLDLGDSTNVKLNEENPVEGFISYAKNSFSSAKDSEVGPNADNEDLDVAPTNLAPNVFTDAEKLNLVRKESKFRESEAELIENDSYVYNGEDLDVEPTNLAPSVVKATSDRQGRYQSAPNTYNSKQTCKEKNERYSVSGSCDRYIECLNGTAEEKLCPDGLLYNPDVTFNVYPCQYPADVQCLGRAALQPAQPTADCPHQFGYFKTGDSRNCSGFRNCVNGVGYDLTCPEGLAFSTDTYRCEWPDQAADCDAEAFLGFRCPEVPISKELGPPAGFRFYRSTSDCQVYFICIEGKPRRLSCGGYSAFDDLTETCINAEEISACPQELRTRAAQAKEEEEARQRLLSEAPKKLKYAAEKFPTNQPTYSKF